DPNICRLGLDAQAVGGVNESQGVFIVRAHASESGGSAAPYFPRTKLGGPLARSCSTNSPLYCASHRSGMRGPPSAAMMAGMVLLCPTTSTTSPGLWLATSA